MAIPSETVWELEPHTGAKHEILKRYLEAWFPILNTFNQRIVYIDGFCGPGRYVGGEPGSPMIALRVAATHRKALEGEIVFWFIDERQDRIAHLRQELAAVSTPRHFTVHSECGRFDEKLKLALDDLAAKGHVPAPTFAFVDPFGFSGIPFSLIARLLRKPSCEALITFMVDAMNRFLEHPRDQVVRHIVDAFGTDDAVRIAEGRGDRVAELRTLYQTRLKSVAHFVRYFEMRDRQDRVQYYLFFATNNRLGHVRMKQAMWAVDPEGSFRFSDATNPQQMVLFEADPIPLLVELLRSRFRKAGSVTGKTVKLFVEDETPFLNKHKTDALKRMEETELQVNTVKINGKKRKAKTYPDDVQMTFVGPEAEK